MVIESSIVIFRSTMFSNASLKIGYPPIRVAAMPITLMCGNGSQTRINRSQNEVFGFANSGVSDSRIMRRARWAPFYIA